MSIDPLALYNFCDVKLSWSVIWSYMS